MPQKRKFQPNNGIDRHLGDIKILTQGLPGYDVIALTYVNEKKFFCSYKKKIIYYPQG